MEITLTPEEPADDGHVLPMSNNMFQRYDVLSSAQFACLFYVIREYPNKPGAACVDEDVNFNRIKVSGGGICYHLMKH
jgi:hypothetical protein